MDIYEQDIGKSSGARGSSSGCGTDASCGQKKHRGGSGVGGLAIVRHAMEKIVQRQGIDGLRSTSPPGRPPKLSKRQRKTFVKILLRGAKAAGFSSDLWTGKRLAEVIQREFSIEYHPHHVLKILRQLDFTPQKPLRRARQQDRDALEHWRTVEWPRIKKGRLAGSNL